MPLLQPRLSLKVSQRQILTPGLMQMVSVLALNKLELKEMIAAEIVENPVLEELEEHVPLLDDVAREEEQRDRPVDLQASATEPEKKDPFDEIDFGSYFQDYLDPGFRSPGSFEEIERPSLENFLSSPGTLSDHLFWQLGSLSLSPALREAAEFIIGNLNEDGYLTATDAELLEGYLREQLNPEEGSEDAAHRPAPAPEAALPAVPQAIIDRARNQLAAALHTVRQLDPIGVATRDLRECLLLQIEAQRREFDLIFRRRHAAAETAAANGHHAEAASDSSPDTVSAAAGDPPAAPARHSDPRSADTRSADSGPSDPRTAVFDLASRIIDRHMAQLQKRDHRELARAVGCSVEETQHAVEFIRTLDPRPGQRYNRDEARLIEPDVAFVRRGEEYVVVMNEEDLPTLRLNQGYRRLLTKDGAEKDVKDYVRERYRSALQLMRNIEQRKNTILRTCEAIVRRQTDFLEKGVDAMRPMMIKEVAEEIGVHPSTVSRAVSNKYVHTPQGVFELRFFFSEGVNGPEGSATPLVLLKRRVKKLIEEEDPGKPLTDDQIATMLQSQGIDVTRRTVAKYREDLRIPSTHQRRVRS
ncbi:RNA polymerase factor sigma-54 [Paracidobacterium acidisoli]|uniref:RNA polymerase sigma-54 factor n=1 Tax=Paracidobacterium acidisoli TaxID=2303751 RepID=A0A372IS49_9BACT|nr:RNA polymerase sigma-54 factor [Paracidobacterium acidisoli]MBT9330720.1 RNA polymerase sigma-54 factor [Paracidobacterium acidisoli]